MHDLIKFLEWNCCWLSCSMACGSHLSGFLASMLWRRKWTSSKHWNSLKLMIDGDHGIKELSCSRSYSLSNINTSSCLQFSTSSVLFNRISLFITYFQISLPSKISKDPTTSPLNSHKQNNLSIMPSP